MIRTWESLREEWISLGKDPEGFDCLVKAENIVISDELLESAKRSINNYIIEKNNYVLVRVFF